MHQTEIPSEPDSTCAHPHAQDKGFADPSPARILWLSRLYAAISETNSALLRSRTAEEVYRAVCCACVRHVGFKLAWIGIATDGNEILPVDAEGPAIALLHQFTVSNRADLPEGQGPAGTAFREQRVCRCIDVFADPALPDNVRAVAAAHGITSAIALPLRRGGKPYGTLTGYGDHRHVFDDEAVRLLQEMADNVSFALDLVDRERQRQHTQAELQKSEQRLRAAQAVCRIGDWELDRDSGEMTWSPQLFELFERDPERGPPDLNEALGYYDLESVQITRELFWKAIDSGERCALEQTLHLPSGRIAHHATLVVPIKNADGRVVKLFGTVQDITERKRAEHELLGKSAEIEDLYQNAPCGYHSLDGDGRIIRINDTELRWLGYTRDEVVGKMGALDILSPACHEVFRQKFPWLKRVGVVRNLELELLRKDGSTLPVLVTSTGIFDANGKFVATRTVLSDNSDRKRLEFERMAHVARLAELSRHLVEVQEHERRILASELHDRASPNLAALKITLANLARSLPDDVLRRTEALLDDAQALLIDTTTGIREICSDLRPATLDYAGLVPALRDYAEQFGRRNRIDVSVTSDGFDVTLAPNIQSLLFRIAQEALTNCAKHASASSVRIRFDHSGATLHMAITDDGIGFDPHTLGKQGATPGLGLLTMRERAEFAGGHFTIDSSPQRGTEIRVSFDTALASGEKIRYHATP